MEIKVWMVSVLLGTIAEQIQITSLGASTSFCIVAFVPTSSWTFRTLARAPAKFL